MDQATGGMRPHISRGRFAAIASWVAQVAASHAAEHLNLAERLDESALDDPVPHESVETFVRDIGRLLEEAQHPSDMHGGVPRPPRLREPPPPERLDLELHRETGLYVLRRTA